MPLSLMCPDNIKLHRFGKKKHQTSKPLTKSCVSNKIWLYINKLTKKTTT